MLRCLGNMLNRGFVSYRNECSVYRLDLFVTDHTWMSQLIEALTQGELRLVHLEQGIFVNLLMNV